VIEIIADQSINSKTSVFPKKLGCFKVTLNMEIINVRISSAIIITEFIRVKMIWKKIIAYNIIRMIININPISLTIFKNAIKTRYPIRYAYNKGFFILQSFEKLRVKF